MTPAQESAIAENRKTPLPPRERENCSVTGKICYATKREARQALGNINQKRARVVSAFRCGYCDTYHLGKRR